ncbi:hypothetical protein DPEC_G00101350 [Dallia pectoralis]|uniref:Uncharacterized protein n=1 Tax=Dallia pectoralis TaxID=75939 RepID=A0ACC2GWP2_DALPE|nr:hypothetical protein DPEC_G00101350 [Dallia pectoralis]
MNCARCLLRLQSLGIVVPSVRAAVRYQLATAPSRITPHDTCSQALRPFHGSTVHCQRQAVPADQEEKDKSLVTYDDLFERVSRETKTKAAFSRVLDVFCNRDIRRRGHVEFIYAALKKMPEFGVERDLTVYNKLLDVFPKEVFVPRNFIQRMYNHYPRQQECGVQLLEQMENYGIMPNMETKVLIVQIFGEKSHPMRKFQRIMYWFPKFKNLNPFPVPQQLPEDPVDLARLSLGRIANDLDAKVTVYQTPCTDTTESGEEVTYPLLVGIQSPGQMEQLAGHNPERPVFVEGPFPLWLRKTCVYYYTLRADPLPPGQKVEDRYDPERSFYYPLQLDLDLDRDLGDDDSFDVEDVDEGPVFAMCMTSQGDQATLNHWISSLQETNPILGCVPTLFRLEAGPMELQGVSDPGHGYGPEGEEETETDLVVEEEEHRVSQSGKQ